ncbi:hypothetical protein ABT024_07030 [Streptomyces sp. NPDC002812]|uniref:hypothetical protein n=1 Tax=Streptomyces sp. NPDC002812 TaxID=3154434 RepID=UPI003317F32A
MIENFNNSAALDELLLGALCGQTNDQLIGNQEKRGQEQLVNSDRLPTEIRGDRADFEALGFVLGLPDPEDPLFAPAALPDGWSREASDHDMWSYVVDELGRRRVAIFYKAAFYDRNADMRLVTLDQCFRDHVYEGRPLITDDTWATPQALAVEARTAIARVEKDLAFWTAYDKPTYADAAVEYAAKYTADRDRYAAVLAHLEAEEARA